VYRDFSLVFFVLSTLFAIAGLDSASHGVPVDHASVLIGAIALFLLGTWLVIVLVRDTMGEDSGL